MAEANQPLFLSFLPSVLIFLLAFSLLIREAVAGRSPLRLEEGVEVEVAHLLLTHCFHQMTRAIAFLIL